MMICQRKVTTKRYIMKFAIKILKNVKSINVSLKRQVPIFVKIAPDISENNVTEIMDACEENGVSGLIATNTTVSSKTLKKPTSFKGGLSGKPLLKPSNRILKLLTLTQ